MGAGTRIELVADVSVGELRQARQVAFFGMGASGSVARDAQHKFFRFNVPVVAYEDGLMLRMHASAMKTGELAVVISHTGRTRAMVEAATFAR